MTWRANLPGVVAPDGGRPHGVAPTKRGRGCQMDAFALRDLTLYYSGCVNGGRAEGRMSEPGWALSEDERGVLGAALDALLPPEGSFPLPSQTDMIDAFILRRIPAAGAGPLPYPGLNADGLRAILARLVVSDGMTAALEALEREQPDEFLALWRLVVYGYYSRPETI